MFAGKKVCLGVTGSIAAYKSADLARELMRQGAEVTVVLTKSAAKLIAPATFEALTGRPVTVDAFDEPFAGKIAHIELAQGSDLIVVAPCTADFLAKMAHGLADDMLSTVLLAADAPVLVAPAMNPKMLDHPATQANIATLKSRGVQFVEPAYGLMACGDEGYGKMADVADIVAIARAILTGKRDFEGEQVLVTAGPTHEPIDPVRHIANRSSGKMGVALAEAARDRGATVVLVLGPSPLKDPIGAETIRVTTAQEMLRAVESKWDSCSLFISAAAVADYRPVESLPDKRKKEEGRWTLKLEPNPDILLHMAKKKGDRIFVGFAAETKSVKKNAKEKLTKKSLDLIVANDVSQKGIGFDSDDNQVILLSRDGQEKASPKMSKRAIADFILDAVSGMLK